MGTPEQIFANYQYEIYLKGIGGEVPSLPITYDDLEAAARGKLTPGAYGYVAGGAGNESTVRANRDAFERWRIVPRMMRDIGVRDLSTEVVGTEMTAPVMLAPVGVQSIIHPEGEVAAARAAAELGVPMVLSTAASNTIEDVAAA